VTVRASLITLCMVCASFLVSPLTAQQDRISRVLADAQRALDGLPNRPLPRTMAIRGTRLALQSQGLAVRTPRQNFTLAVEIYAEFPDKFVWIEDGGANARTVRGFDGRRLITNAPERLAQVLPGQESTAAYALGRIQRDVDQLIQIRADFVALTLGLFGRSFPSVPLTFSEITGAQAANAVGISTRDGYAATAVFDEVSGLPAWLATREMVPVAGETGGAVTRRWVYEDYRAVDARRLPHLLRGMMTASDSGPMFSTSVLTITDYAFDVPINPKVFKR